MQLEFFAKKDDILKIKCLNRKINLQKDFNLQKLMSDTLYVSPILSSIEKYNANIYGERYDKVYEYNTLDIKVILDSSILPTYKNIFDLVNLKRMNDMYVICKDAIVSMEPTRVDIKINKTNDDANMCFVERNEDSCNYQIYGDTFDEIDSDELFYIERLIEVFMRKYPDYKYVNGDLVYEDKSLNGIDDLTKEIIDRKVLKYGKK